MNLIYFVQGDPAENELVASAAIGNYDRVEALLADGISPNVIDSRWRRTALHTASSGGHHLVVASLLQRKARLDISDGNGLTALMSACSAGHSKVALILMEAGADVMHKRLQDGMTALKFAIWGRCSRKVMKELIARGAEPAEVGFPVVWLNAGRIGAWRKWALRIFLCVGAISMGAVMLEIIRSRA